MTATTPTSRWPRGAVLAALVLVVVAGVLRLLWLDADPGYGHWQGFVTDEGRWVENARNLYLFHTLGLERLHLLIAPLYQAISFAVFSVADIGRTSTRLLPAVAGSALLFFMWLGLRRHVTPIPLLACLLLLATQEDMVMLSRVSVPEMPAMLFEWLAFIVLVRAEGRVPQLLLAGALVTACVAMKATTAPVVITFALVVWLIGEGSGKERARRTVYFVAIPLAVAASLLLFVAAFALLSAAGLPNDLGTIAGFVRTNEAYRIAAFGLQAPLAPTFYAWVLPAWFAGIIWCVQPAGLDTHMRRWYIASAIWVLSYIPLAAGLEYYPLRYQVHALVPLAALLAVSLQILLTPAASNVAVRFHSLSGSRRLASAALLALPSAVLLAAFALGCATSFVPGLDRLSVRLVSIVLAWLVLATLCSRRRPNVDALASGSTAAVLAWYAGHRLAGWHFWLPPDLGSWAVQWAIITGIAVTVIACRRRLSRRPAIAVAVSVVALAAVAPYISTILWPTFTLRDASRDIGQFLDGHTNIVSDGAEGLFVDNRLTYTSDYRLPGELQPGSTVVRFESEKRPVRALSPGYREVRRYLLETSSRNTAGPLYIVILHDVASDD